LEPARALRRGRHSQRLPPTPDRIGAHVPEERYGGRGRAADSLGQVAVDDQEAMPSLLANGPGNRGLAHPDNLRLSANDADDLVPIVERGRLVVTEGRGARGFHGRLQKDGPGPAFATPRGRFRRPQIVKQVPNRCLCRSSPCGSLTDARALPPER